nr:MAG TPA: hypothetical protein [Caudoviricetes sp.]
MLLQVSAVPAREACKTLTHKKPRWAELRKEHIWINHLKRKKRNSSLIFKSFTGNTYKSIWRGKMRIYLL